MVFGAGHGDLGRVALLVQQLVEGVQLIALVQGREISRLQYVTTGNTTQSSQQQKHKLEFVILESSPHNPLRNGFFMFPQSTEMFKHLKFCLLRVLQTKCIPGGSQLRMCHET